MPQLFLAASGFVAEETLTLGSFALPQQAFGVLLLI